MDKKTLVWAYVIEVIASFLIYAAVYIYGGEKFLHFSEKMVNDIPGLVGAFLAIVIALWLYWGGLQRSDFGKYLIWKKADKVYTTAYSYQVILFIIVLIVSNIGKNLPNRGVHIRCILFLYSLINMWTVVRNTWWLMKLSGKFHAELNNYKE